MKKTRAEKFKKIFFTGSLFFILSPTLVSAICCNCHTASEPTKNICLTGNFTCAELTIKTENNNVKSLTCQDLDQAKCLQATAGGPGECQTGPVVADTYSPPTDITATEAIPPFQLNVQIPGLSFSGTTYRPGETIQIPFLAQYIVAVYNYLIGVAVIAVAIMLVYGGFRYIVGSTQSNVTRGKQIISDALIGLLLILGSYTILNVLNPETTQLKPLEVKTVIPLAERFNNDAVADEANFRANVPPPSEQTPSTPESTSRPPPAPQEPLSEDDLIKPSDITYDGSLGGAGNWYKNCNTYQGEMARAETYQKKMKILAKAVLSAKKICVDNRQCVYCQGCGTAAGGTIAAYPKGQWSAMTLITNGIKSPNSLWPSDENCRVAYSGGAVSNKPECAGPTIEAYKNLVVAKMQEAKMYATDCGSFRIALYSCIGPPKTKNNANGLWSQPGTFSGTYFLPIQAFGKIKNNPNLVFEAHMTDDISAIAAANGGLRFGDLIYTTDNISSHWMIWTGGRPDVPFNMIDMGSGNAAVPGAGGGHQGVGIINESLENLIQKLTTKRCTRTKRTDPGQCLEWSRPHYKENGVIWVWRPILP